MSITLELKYGTPLHTRIRDALRARIKLSRRYMQDRHDAWRRSDESAIAYIKESEKNALRRQKREDTGVPQYTTLMVPYSTALVLTAHTYWSSVFLSRNPIFQYQGLHGEAQTSEQAVEALMAYQVQVGGMTAPLYVWIMDGAKYGLGVISAYWEEEEITVSTIEEEPVKYLGIPITGKMQKVRKTKTLPGYIGNKLFNVRPYNFLPDPRVPISQLQKGEFVGRETTFGWNEILRRTIAKQYTNAEVLKRLRNSGRGELAEQGSDQLLLPATTDSVLSTSALADITDVGFFTCVEMYVELIPNDWGLGTSTKPEKWYFVLAENEVVLCARPYGSFHNQYPFFIQEYEIDGYQLTKRSMYDYLDPLNNLLTWLFETHLQNVRKVINDNIIVDPSKLVMKDVLNPTAGRLWRLRPEAYGTDVRSAAFQFQVTDVTQQHMRDAPVIMELMQRLSGVNENMLGMINQGGRKTATEIRSSNMLGINRLKTTAEYNSAVGWNPCASVMLRESQQRYTMNRKHRIVGTGAMDKANFIDVSPESLQGFYDFIPVDGTMPIDRFAMSNLLRELAVDSIKMPGVAQQMDFMRLVEEIAQLNGIRYFNKFKLQLAPDALMASQAQAGNIIPMGGTNGGTNRGNGSAGAPMVPGPSQVRGMGPTQ